MVKFVYATSCIYDFLGAGVERVAGRAHVHADLTGGDGGAGLEGVATGARDRGGHVVGVDALLHRFLLKRQRVPGPTRERG